MLSLETICKIHGIPWRAMPAPIVIPFRTPPSPPNQTGWSIAHFFDRGYCWYHEDGRLVTWGEMQHYLQLRPKWDATDDPNLWHSLITALRDQDPEVQWARQRRPILRVDRIQMPNITNMGSMVDIRQLLSDNSIRDILDEVDGRQR